MVTLNTLDFTNVDSLDCLKSSHHHMAKRCSHYRAGGYVTRRFGEIDSIVAITMLGSEFCTSAAPPVIME